MWNMRALSLASFALSVLTSAASTPAAAEYATSASPLAFGPDQSIIDLNKVQWSPLELEGFPAGAEIAVLRGDLAHGSESIVRVPAGYVIPHLHQRPRWERGRDEWAELHQPPRQRAPARDQVQQRGVPLLPTLLATLRSQGFSDAREADARAVNDRITSGHLPL